MRDVFRAYLTETMMNAIVSAGTIVMRVSVDLLGGVCTAAEAACDKTSQSRDKESMQKKGLRMGGGGGGQEGEGGGGGAGEGCTFGARST